MNGAGVDEKGLVLAPSVEIAHLVLSYRTIAVLSLQPARGQSNRSQQRFLHDLILKFAVLTHHSLPLHQALGIVMHQTPAGHNRANIEALYYEIKRGSSLAEALSLYFSAVSPYVIALLRSSEASGKLASTMQLLAHYFDQQAALRKKIVAAVTPPLLTLAFTLTVLIVLLLAVVPQFERLFAVLEKPIPKATATLLAVAQAVRSWQFCAALACCTTAFWFLVASLTVWRSLRVALHRLQLYIPFVGSIIIRLEMSRFFNIIGILSDAALPLHAAAGLAATSAHNVVIATWLADLTEQLQHGQSLIQAVEALPHPIRQELRDLLAPTETLGVKKETLALACSSLEQDGYKILERIILLIGPLLLLAVGGIIFAILIFLYMPLFSLANSM
jgi:type IV pilus assembly protein PilC